MNLEEIEALDEAEFTNWTLRIQKKIIDEIEEPGKSELTGLLMTYVMERDLAGIRVLAARFGVPLRTENEQQEVNDTRRQSILDTFSDAMGDFLYYSRKEDDELPVGSIERAVKDGVLSVDDLVEVLRAQFK